jgi:hypothetical protein
MTQTTPTCLWNDSADPAELSAAIGREMVRQLSIEGAALLEPVSASSTAVMAGCHPD